MISYVDAQTARQTFGTLMDRAQYLNEVTIVRRANKPVAAIVSTAFLEAIERYNSDLTKDILASVGNEDISFERALGLAGEARRAVLSK